jgi:hypothetical protein
MKVDFGAAQIGSLLHELPRWRSGLQVRVDEIRMIRRD